MHKDDEMIAENARLNKLIADAAEHWLALQQKHQIPWEGAIDGAMQAACASIEALTAALEKATPEGFVKLDDFLEKVALENKVEALTAEVERLKEERDLWEQHARDLEQGIVRAALQPQEKVG